MIEQRGLTGEDKRGAKLIRKVVFTYRYESDPKDTERTMVLEHGGSGDVIDGLIWNDELIRKLAYIEDKDCREVTKKEGTGEWKTYAKDNEKTNCIWVHDPECIWSEYCSDI